MHQRQPEPRAPRGGGGCEVKVSQQPSPGTRMYLACYIPEPTMYGAHCQRGLCSPRENCLPARCGEQRDSIRGSCDIKASIVALGETIRRFLVKKKKKESNQNHETRQTKRTQASEQLPDGGAPRGAEGPASWRPGLCPGGHRCFCRGCRACFLEAALGGRGLCRRTREPRLSGKPHLLAVVSESYPETSLRALSGFFFYIIK